MLKRGLALAAALLLPWCAASAQILPPMEPGADGQWAVVLRDELPVWQDRLDRTENAPVVGTLHWGDQFCTQDRWDGWADCFFDQQQLGWVEADFLVVDPSWYLADEDVPVYALEDVMAPKVALLKAGERRPILAEEEDWVAVSLPGGAGWIRKTALDKTDAQTMDALTQLSGLVRAELHCPAGDYVLTEEEGLRWIEENFSIARPEMSAGCPFDATLTLIRGDGARLTLRMATDSCRIFVTEDGSAFSYGDGDAALKAYGSTSEIARRFWQLFGLDTSRFYGQ